MRKVLLFWIIVIVFIPAIAQDVRPLDVNQARYIRSENLGVTFLAFTNNIGKDADERYRNALAMGVGWNRYPIYWHQVERSSGVFDWSAYDQLVDTDRRNGIRTNAIFLGIPDGYKSGGSIAGIYEPVFADGSDTSAPGKAINPANPYARYVSETVNRYRPGGVLARQRNWLASDGIRVWEAWNEPDLNLFWQGSKADYARLLKITYLAVKSVDNNASVMFGGLAYGNPDTDDWLKDVLDIYLNDPAREQYNWYMDLVGLHSYNDARRTGLVVTRVKDTLADYGLNRPIWVNETGVAIWDDYPGPEWAANNPEARRLHATQDQQAAFVLQSAAYAFAAGADKVFFHQFYDDCGDNGGAYSAGSQGGLVFGFYRNRNDAECYTGHSRPGTARAAVGAYRTLAQVFGNANVNSGRILRRNDGSVFLRFQVGNNERVTVLWNERPQENTITWEAESTSAQLYDYDNQRFSIVPRDGSYTVTLPQARLNDDPNRAPGQNILIGGRTFVMREQVFDDAQQLAGAAPVLPGVVTPRAPLPSQIGSVLGSVADSPDVSITLANTTVIEDVSPPITGMDALPEISPDIFMVRWHGADAGGIEKYVVWVRVNDGEWGPWLETSQTSSEYIGTSGSTYSFAVWAVDFAGNWSLNTDLRAQTLTTVE